MKQLLTIIVALVISVSARADCTSNGLYIFPTGEIVRPNSIFILEGYAMSQEIILELNKKYKIYLQSGNRKVHLTVAEVCVGEFSLTQALLKPETDLEPGLEYTLRIDSLPQYESVRKFNLSGGYQPLTYKVTSLKDTEKPQLKSIPKEIKKTLKHYGCGPETFVIFESPATDDSEIFVKTTVKNIETGKETSYYLQPSRGQLMVGHGMCCGAFRFDKGKNYEVEFSFMDASGNITLWTGKRIKFTAPTEGTGDE